MDMVKVCLYWGVWRVHAAHASNACNMDCLAHACGMCITSNWAHCDVGKQRVWMHVMLSHCYKLPGSFPKVTPHCIPLPQNLAVKHPIMTTASSISVVCPLLTARIFLMLRRLGVYNTVFHGGGFEISRESFQYGVSYVETHWTL